MELKSTAFDHMGRIPREYTCDGADRSPPLEWSEVPRGAQSLVLIIDDPDAPDPRAPKMTYVHWVLYDIPPQTGGLKAGIAREELPAGTRSGINDWKRPDYGGPCPPVGRHRYVHKLYALDTKLQDLGFPEKHTVEESMEGHILARAELVGLYERHE